jgi:4,5-dihydroxyphthalate decarboxylase
MSVQQMTRLRAALGDYAHALPLKKNEITSASVAFEFSEIKPVFRAFGTMIREQAFDVSEMAIASYLQAKAHGKPLVWWWSAPSLPSARRRLCARSMCCLWPSGRGPCR